MLLEGSQLQGRVAAGSRLVGVNGKDVRGEYADQAAATAFQERHLVVSTDRSDDRRRSVGGTLLVKLTFEPPATYDVRPRGAGALGLALGVHLRVDRVLEVG